MYKVGKSSSLGGKHSVSHEMGKRHNASGAKVTAAAGKKSGTMRDGDKKGAPAMGKGK